MLKFNRKDGVKYYPNSTFRVKPESRRSANSTLRPMSDRAKQRMGIYRNKGFEHWGYRCFLCGRIDESGKTLDIHHPRGRQNGDDITNLIPLCNRFYGCHAHNHSGHDARFYELQSQINKKMEETNGRNNTN